MPDLRRRFCLTSRSVTQSTPNRTPEEVIGLDGDQDRTRSECRTSRSPSRVLPVIGAPGNPDFPGYPPGVLITERRGTKSEACEGSHTAGAVCGPPEFRAKRTWRRIHATPPPRQTGREAVCGPSGRDHPHGCPRPPPRLRAAPTGRTTPSQPPCRHSTEAARDGAGQSGSTTRITRPPPSRGSAVMLPSCARTTDRTMDSPRPTPLSLPVRSVRSRRNGSKRFSTS